MLTFQQLSTYAQKANKAFDPLRNPIVRAVGSAMPGPAGGLFSFASNYADKANAAVSKIPSYASGQIASVPKITPTPSVSNIGTMPAPNSSNFSAYFSTPTSTSAKFTQPYTPPAPEQTPIIQPLNPQSQVPAVTQHTNAINDLQTALDAQKKAAESQLELDKAQKAAQQKILQDQVSQGQDRVNIQGSQLDAKIPAYQEQQNQAYEGDIAAIAKTRKDQIDELNKTYSSLGSLESEGVGSYVSNRKKLEDGVIDRQTYARNLRDIAVTNFKNTIFDQKQKLQNDFDTNSMQLKQAIAQLASDPNVEAAQKKVIASQLYDQYVQQVGKLNETARQHSIQSSLFNSTSDIFKSTGVPSTAEDMKFLQLGGDNAIKVAQTIQAGSKIAGDQYTELMKLNNTSKDTSGAKANMVGLIDEILSKDTKPITGTLQIGPYFQGDPSQLTANKFNQLQSMLSLGNREQLKGSGAISDFEAKMLEKAASSLGRNLGDEDFRNELLKLKQSLSGGTNGTTNFNVSSQDPLLLR